MSNNMDQPPQGSFPSTPETPPERKDLENSAPATGGEPAVAGEGEQNLPFSFDPICLLEGVLRRWRWLLAASACLGLLGFFYGWWQVQYWTEVQLMTRDMPNVMDTPNGTSGYRPKEISDETLTSLMTSSELMQRVSAQTDPPIPANELKAMIEIRTARNTDIISVRMRGADPETLVKRINLFARETVRLTQEMQQEEARVANQYLQDKLAESNEELDSINRKLDEFSRSNQLVDVDTEISSILERRANLDMQYENTKIELDSLDFKISNLTRQSPKLMTARQELGALRSKYTDEHPAVQAKEKEVQKLEEQAARLETKLAEGGTNAISEIARSGLAQGGDLPTNMLDLLNQKRTLANKLNRLEAMREEVNRQLEGLSGKASQFGALKSRQQQLEITRNLLANYQRDAELFQQNAQGYYRLFNKAELSQVQADGRLTKAILLAMGGGFLGFVFAAFLGLVSEWSDQRLKSPLELKQLTHMPILGKLGDLENMSSGEQTQWGFRTWTKVQGHLKSKPNGSMICGVISANYGEGRSTWVNMLAQAAHQRGHRVLTVTVLPSPLDDLVPTAEAPGSGPHDLAFPEKIAKKLSGSQSSAMVHIQISGANWSLDKRKAWEKALQEWSTISNLVILVELPPASATEGILFAETLPQIIWLSGHSQCRSGEVQSHLETLRFAGCDLVGAFWNREPTRSLRNFLSRWIPTLGMFMLGLFSAAAPVQGAESSADPAPAGQQPATDLNLSVSESNRAAWQQRLTLGPGDVLDLQLYGYPDLSRTGVFIRPDGRISYLQAQDVKAVGLTVDELRSKLDQVLAQYYQTARTIIQPVAFRSKKYVILGNVAQKGVFTLDRPVTIVEAIALAGGFQISTVEQHTFEMVDLSRSFLIREGEPLSINFEQLFKHGDLGQNVALQPNDYLYFPPLNLPEIYVLGSVSSPGIAAFTENATVLRAITRSGGFTPQAYKQKVLVVRGSLNRPETFVVDTKSILDAEAADFKLQARDIVYVNDRPWIKAEELLDTAANAFIRAAVVGWTGANVGPFITEPIIE